MPRIFTSLAATKMLWLTFLTTLALTIGFGMVMHVWDFGLIDEMHDSTLILAHIDAMTPLQRTVHIWMTATLDVAYPFAYAGFFIGMAIRHFPKAGKYLALPNVLVIPTDLSEGLVQVLLLNGVDTVVGLKTILTPLKLGLFWFGLAVTLFALVRMVYTRALARRQNED